MRVLLVIAHHFSAEKNPKYSSNDERQRESRRRSIMQVVLAWRAHFNESTTINVGKKHSELNRGHLEKLDIGVVVSGNHHLLDDGLERSLGVQRIEFKLENPRLLPFTAQRVMADNASRYDWFVYSEDDLLVHDATLFNKLVAFQLRFGAERVLLPNRFEINPRALRAKTYIDGDLRAEMIEKFLERVPEAHAVLTQDTELGPLLFARARNPHSGFFALSAEQFSHWKAQEHFLDLDSSFVSPLESAATLGLLKTFSIFKPAAPNLHYLEIQHLDSKFSDLRLPIAER